MPPTGTQLSEIIDGYVILVDYGNISNCSYERTVLELGPAIGFYVAKVIKDFNLNLQKMEFIGHSVGNYFTTIIIGLNE